MGTSALPFAVLALLLSAANGQQTARLRKQGYDRSVKSCPHGQVVSSDGRASVILVYQNTIARSASQITRRTGDAVERTFETIDATSAMLTKATIDELIEQDEGLMEIEADCARPPAPWFSSKRALGSKSTHTTHAHAHLPPRAPRYYPAR